MTVVEWFIKAAKCAVCAKGFERLGQYGMAHIAAQYAALFVAEGLIALALSAAETEMDLLN